MSRASNPRWITGRAGDQAGQMVPIIAVALLLAGVLGLGLIQLGAAVARQAAAQAAADAVALAGAAGGADAARRVASDNDANIEEMDLHPGDAQVTVERRGHRATARARRMEPDREGWPRPSGARAVHPVDCRPCLIAPMKQVPM